MPYPPGAIACAALLMAFVAICGVVVLTLGLARAAGKERPKPADELAERRARRDVEVRRIGGVR